jgi:protein-tyrosine phosphatase
MENGEDLILIYESYWVIHKRFRVGVDPGSILGDEARRKFRWLLDPGTNLILDLTDEGEAGLKPYFHLLDEEAIKINRPVVYKRIPIQDFGRPSPEKMVEILDTIDAGLSEGKNTYLHCRGGRGRTGTVVGCHLARHGILGEKALEMIQELRKDIPGNYKESPETDGQRRMVMEWIKGQ